MITDAIGRQTWILDGGEVSGRQSLHQKLKEVLHLPDYYGGNLDALYDCLSEMTGTLYVYRQAELRRALGAYGDKLLRVFRDSESPYFRVILVD